MARFRRRALLGSQASLADDLRAARAAGGLEVADLHDLAGLVHFLTADPAYPRDPNEIAKREDPLGTARTMYRVHTIEVCAQVNATSSTDACMTAAAASLSKVLLDGPDADSVQGIRRTSAERFGCYLELTGIRRREDAIINEIARAVWTTMHVDNAAEPKGLLTVLAHAGEVAAEVSFYFHDVMIAINDREMLPALPRDRIADAATGFAYTRRLMVWLLSLAPLDDILDPQRRQVIGQIAVRLLATVPGSTTTQDALERFARGWDEPVTVFDAATKMMNDPRMAEPLASFERWLMTCHSECRYERSGDFEAMCPPHEFATLLKMFVVIVDQVKASRRRRLDEVSADATK